MAIQIRRGTNTEWESNNSNIVAGEPAIATDAERFFVGTASGDYAEFANLDIIAPAYDTSASYVVGDVINRQGKLYSCNTPCSGAFNVSYWDEKSLAEILKYLENEIDYAQYEIGYADGELITIDNGASEIPVKDLTVDIEAVQSGSGDPSPTNIRPISGWTGANIYVSPTADEEDATVYPITWQTEAGTVYGGTLDVTTGVLTVTHAEIDLGSIGWGKTTVGTNIPIFYSDAISDRKGGSKDLVCSNYRTINGYRADLANNDFAIADYNGANARVAIRDSNYNNATTAEFKTAMDGVQLVYDLATPQVVQLTPTQIRTVLGTNNLWNQMNSNNELAYRISNALN